MGDRIPGGRTEQTNPHLSPYERAVDVRGSKIMTGVTFPDFGIKHSEYARKTRQSLPPQLRRVADEVEAELAMNPDKYLGRLIPASKTGAVQIYKDPETRLEITFELDRESKIIY